MIGEAARLFVTVGLNSEAASKGLTSLSKQFDHTGASITAWGKTVGSAFRGPLEAFGEIGDAADGVREVGNAIAGVASTLLGGAARNEQYATSFEVLLGSAEKADDKLRELKKFAASTPFTLPGIVEASKQLEVMGGAALNTDANLRMVGDAASFAGQDIKDVAVYFGRLYDGMKNGTPLGEVNMRLGEMGIMSGESKRKIQALADGVKEGTITMEEAWRSAGGEFSRFAGQTQKQSETLNGLWSTFTDTIDDGLATIGSKLLPKIKPALKEAIKLFEGLGAAGVYLVDNIETLTPVILAVLIPAVGALTIAVFKLAAGVALATWPFLAIGAAVFAAYQAMKTIDPELTVVTTLLNALGWFLGEVVAGVGDLVEALQFVASPLGNLRDALFGVPEAATAAGDAVAYVGKTTEELPGKLADSTYAISAYAAQSFKPIETEASKAARETVRTVDTMLSDILTSFENTRNAVTGAASTLTTAITRPFELALEIQKAKSDLSETEAKAHNKKLKAEERKAAADALAAKQAHLFQLLTEETTYGTTQERIAKINALLANNAYADTLKNGTVEQRAAYQAWVRTMQEQLNALEGVARKEGQQAGTAAGAGFKSGLPAPGTVKAWGGDLAKQFGDGISASRSYIMQKGKYAVTGLREIMESGSPPGPKSPLHKIDLWGERTGEAWGAGLADAIAAAERSVRSALAGVGNVVAPSTMAAAAGSGGGVTVNVTIGDFHGTDENIRTLSEQLGEVVRYSTLRRSS